MSLLFADLQRALNAQPQTRFATGKVSYCDEQGVIRVWLDNTRLQSDYLRPVAANAIDLAALVLDHTIVLYCLMIDGGGFWFGSVSPAAGEGIGTILRHITALQQTVIDLDRMLSTNIGAANKLTTDLAALAARVAALETPNPSPSP